MVSLLEAFPMLSSLPPASLRAVPGYFSDLFYAILQVCFSTLQQTLNSPYFCLVIAWWTLARIRILSSDHWRITGGFPTSKYPFSPTEMCPRCSNDRETSVVRTTWCIEEVTGDWPAHFSPLRAARKDQRSMSFIGERLLYCFK